MCLLFLKEIEKENKVALDEPFIQQLMGSVHNSDLFFTEEVIPLLFSEY